MNLGCFPTLQHAGFVDKIFHHDVFTKNSERSFLF